MPLILPFFQAKNEFNTQSFFFRRERPKRKIINRENPPEDNNQRRSGITSQTSEPTRTQNAIANEDISDVLNNDDNINNEICDEVTSRSNNNSFMDLDIQNIDIDEFLKSEYNLKLSSPVNEVEVLRFDLTQEESLFLTHLLSLKEVAYQSVAHPNGYLNNGWSANSFKNADAMNTHLKYLSEKQYRLCCNIEAFQE